MNCLFYPITLFILVLLSSARVSAQPLISVKDSLIEFGDVYKGATAAHEIRILNTGTAPLLIEDVASPCNCTSAVLQSNIVNAGDSTNLAIKFNSKNFLDS